MQFIFKDETSYDPISVCIRRGRSHPTWLQPDAVAISFTDWALNYRDVEHVRSLDDPGAMVDAGVRCAGTASTLRLATRRPLFLCMGAGFIQFLNDLVKAIEPAKYYSLLLSPPPLSPISLDGFLKIYRLELAPCRVRRSAQLTQHRRQGFGDGRNCSNAKYFNVNLNGTVPEPWKENDLPSPASWTNSPLQLCRRISQKEGGRQGSVASRGGKGDLLPFWLPETGRAVTWNCLRFTEESGSAWFSFTSFNLCSPVLSPHSLQFVFTLQNYLWGREKKKFIQN